MRGTDERPGSLFSYVDIEARVPVGHPLRRIRELVNGALAELDERFAGLYSTEGRPSIPPERLIRASLLQLFYSIRSERQLIERMDFDLCSAGLWIRIDDAVWDHRCFQEPRPSLTTEIAQDFLAALLLDPKIKRLLSHEHFSVDGTLLKAWASMKSFRLKDGSGNPPDGGRNGEQDFRGEKRSNETHESTTDPDARLYRKGNGQESRLCYMGHAVMENRHGLAVCGGVTHATGTAEREAALAWIDEHGPAHRITLAATKPTTFSSSSRLSRSATLRRTLPLTATSDGTASRAKPPSIGAPTRHAGYWVSQRIRKRIEEIFGWVKTIGGLAQLKVRGLEKANAAFILALAAYNLIRLPKLLEVPP
jgi:transposase